MYIKLFLIILVASCFCVSSYSQDKLKFVRIKTTLKEDQSLAILYSKFVKDDSTIKKSSPMTRKTFKANPKIKNWRKLKKGTRVTLYLNKAYLDPVKMDVFKSSLLKKKNKSKATNRTKKQQVKHFNITASGGVIGISDDDNNTLDMNFFKFSVNYSNKFKAKYSYQVGIGAVTFFDLKYSESSETVSHNSFLPELNLGLSRSLSKKFSLGLSYDYLNYFVLSDASETTFNLDPKEIHRLNVKPSYRLSSSFGLISSIGHLSGAGNGIDGSLGVIASIGKNSKFQGSIALIGYFSRLNVEDRKESSNAIVVSLGMML